VVELPATHPVVAAQVAGLRYVSDADPGIRRRRRGKGFAYLGPDGRAVRDAPTLSRIRALAVPPAWTDVWICPWVNGHIQATGRDARGRKQYRYHSRWRAVRDETKYHRMIAFGKALPRIRARAHADLGRAGLPREKVLAAVVRLLETTFLRVGNDEYARDNGS
jgi:DNA topoisomerase I